MIEIGKETDSE